MPRPLSYRSDVDGLRALAVFSVVMFHGGVWPFRGGFAGVDVFFVISGFLISGIVLREAESGSFSFVAFYERRARRILPALFCVIGFSWLVSIALLPPSELLDFARIAVATVLAVSNVKFWWGINYFAPIADSKPLLMTWSLGVEEQFYLFWPVLILLLAKRGRHLLEAVVAVISLASLVLSVWMTRTHPTGAFFLLPPRAWELGAGTLTMLAMQRRHAWSFNRSRITDVVAVGGVALLASAFLLLGPETPFPGYAALLPVTGTVLLLLTGESWVNRRILSSAPAVFTGQISYSWYLWHWPLLCFAGRVVPGALPIASAFAMIALSFGLGFLSWRFVEQPFRRHSEPAWPILRRYAVGMALACLPALPVVMSAGWPQRFQPELLRLDRAEREVQTDACLANYGVAHPSAAPGCVPSAPAQSVVAVIGDSHAAALVPGWRALSRITGETVWQLTKSSCPDLYEVTRYSAAHPGLAAECRAFNRQVQATILTNPAVRRVVIAANWSAALRDGDWISGYAPASAGDRLSSPAASRNALSMGLRQLVDRLVQAGRHVVVVIDVPGFDFDVDQVSKTQLIPVRRWLWQTLDGRKLAPGLSNMMAPGLADETSALLRQTVDPNDAIQLLDLRARFCDGGTCRFRDGTNIFYVDRQHLSAAGAIFALHDEIARVCSRRALVLAAGEPGARMLAAGEGAGLCRASELYPRINPALEVAVVQGARAAPGASAARVSHAPPPAPAATAGHQARRDDHQAP